MVRWWCCCPRQEPDQTKRPVWVVLDNGTAKGDALEEDPWGCCTHGFRGPLKETKPLQRPIGLGETSRTKKKHERLPSCPRSGLDSGGGVGGRARIYRQIAVAQGPRPMAQVWSWRGTILDMSESRRAIETAAIDKRGYNTTHLTTPRRAQCTRPLSLVMYSGRGLPIPIPAGE